MVHKQEDYVPLENGVFPSDLTSQPQKCGHYSIQKQWKNWTHVNPFCKHDCIITATSPFCKRVSLNVLFLNPKYVQAYFLKGIRITCNLQVCKWFTGIPCD